jgi:hypothetical protein
MSIRTTFAVLGVSERNSVFLAKQVARTNRVLLFDKNEAILLEVHAQILSEHPKANTEIMICPINASWEADSIILSHDMATDSNLIEKIRNVATGKIVLFLVQEMNRDTIENSLVKLQYLFPFSKVVQSVESTSNSNDFFLLNGDDEEALKTIWTLFTSIGLKANTVLPNTNFNKKSNE